MSQKFALESNLEEKFSEAFDSLEEFEDETEKYIAQLNEGIESGKLGGSFELFSDGGAYIVYYGCEEDIVDFALREDEFWDGYDNLAPEELAELAMEAAYPISE